MKKPSLYAAGASLVYFFIALCVPVAAGALPESPIVIAEVQPGSSDSASEEFIELFNVSDRPIDLDANHWQIITASASAKTWTPYRTAALHGVINPGESYLVGSTYTYNGATVHYLPLAADAIFTAGLSATGGHVRVSYTTNAVLSDDTCGPADNTADMVEWSTVSGGTYSAPSITGRTLFGISTKVGIAPPDTLQRRFDVATGTYADTDNDAADFILSSASPRLPNLPLTLRTSVFSLLPFPSIVDSCDPTQSVPPSDTGPTEPTDPSPSPTDDGTAGSGTGGGTTPDDNQTSPDTGVNNGLVTPVITELLPNPAAPQTDAADEFIELYNPNETDFDLSGYVLEAGGSTMRRYAIPAGVQLAPHAYQAFYSAVTGLSLPNSGGSARLLSPDGAAATTDTYATAPDGQAWAVADGDNMWQWTTTATPSAPNAITQPAAVKKATTTAAKQTTKKAATVKSASTTKPKAAAAPKAKKAAKTPAKKTELSPVAAAVRNPIHIGVLAAVGVFALLYGAYEYRHDVANKIHQFRSDRVARRAARQGVARRGGD